MSRRVLSTLAAVIAGCALLAATATATATATGRHGPRAAHRQRTMHRRGAAPRRRATHHRTHGCPRPGRAHRSRRTARHRLLLGCLVAIDDRVHRPLAVAAAAPSGKPARHGGSGSRTGSGASRPLVVGINANVSGWGDASTQPRMAQVVSQTHTKWLREDFHWDQIEPAPGQFDFSYYDHFMLIAAQAGVHILPVLYHAPAWAGANYNAIPADPTAYAQYVAAVIGRYGPNGTFWNQYPSLRSSAIQTWELWNEPYYASGDNGLYDPGRYARLVKAAAIAGRAVDPNAQFLLASEMQSAQDASGNWQWWTDALYQAVPDLNNYFDGVAVHPYGNNTTTLNPTVYGQPYNNYNSLLRIQDIHQQFLNHDATNKPFWITEIGWTTCTTDPTCVTPAQQATNLTNLFNDLHTNWSTWVHAAFIYHYTDAANPTTNPEDAYGLTTNTGTPKPALSIFQNQATLSTN